jgi:hypothetical protein
MNATNFSISECGNIPTNFIQRVGGAKFGRKAMLYLANRGDGALVDTASFESFEI